MSTRTTFRNDIKIIVIGNSGVGKTSFVNKWTKNTFNENSTSTIGSEFVYKIFEIMAQYIMFNYGILQVKIKI